MMANTDKNCSVLKLANTFGSEMNVERNSSMGMVMWTVDRGRDLGQVEQHLRQICSLHYSITTSK